jgi:primosomal protein N'
MRYYIGQTPHAISHAFQPVPVVAVLLAIAAILLRRPKFRASKQFHHRTGQQTGRAHNG